jgi:hypothetical protein
MSRQHRQDELLFVRQDIRQAHGPITLDPGLWLVVRKPAYNPEVIRTVLN